jgi:chromosome segregation ATPase
MATIQAFQTEIKYLKEILSQRDESLRRKDQLFADMSKRMIEKDEMIEDLKQRLYFYDPDEPNPSSDADESETQPEEMEGVTEEAADKPGAQVAIGNSHLDTLAALAAAKPLQIVTPESEAAVDSKSLKAIESENAAKDKEIEDLKRKIESTRAHSTALEGDNAGRDQKIEELKKEIARRDEKLEKLESQKCEVMKVVVGKEGDADKSEHSWTVHFSLRSQLVSFGMGRATLARCK